MKISRIVLGCMSFGAPGTGRDWTLDHEDAEPIFRQGAVELGITFWDTANTYGQGTSEEIVGRAIKNYIVIGPDGARTMPAWLVKRAD